MRNLTIVLLYLLIIGLVLGGMFSARRWANASMSQPAAQEEWQTFREDVEEMNESSPVQRRVPKSVEPPALVLMRDHFTACAVISVVLTSALYATTVFMVLGSLGKKS